jgi:hypothetical protein
MTIYYRDPLGLLDSGPSLEVIGSLFSNKLVLVYFNFLYFAFVVLAANTVVEPDGQDTYSVVQVHSSFLLDDVLMLLLKQV